MQEDSLSAEPPGKPKDFLTLNQNWNMQTSFPSCLLHQHLCVSSCNKQYSEIISASERQCLWFYPSFIILEKKSQRNDYLILKARQKSISETVWLESSLLLDNISFSHSVMSDSWRPHGTCQRRRRGKIPWRRKWHPLQYSCLGNPMNGGAWRATTHGVAKSGTRQSY